MLAEYDVVWFEEALRPDDLQGYIKLTEHAPLPITSCEVLTRRQSFMPWIEERAVDYIQPDVTKVGGLSEEYRIAMHAYDHSILFVPHGWNTAIGLAADLQLVAAVPTARWVEYITPAPYIEDLVAEPLLDPHQDAAPPFRYQLRACRERARRRKHARHRRLPGDPALPRCHPPRPLPGHGPEAR